MKLTVYPYVADEHKWNEYSGLSVGQRARFLQNNPINEEYFNLEGFDLTDDELSFVMHFSNGKMVKTAAVLKLDSSEKFELKKILDGEKFPQ